MNEDSKPLPLVGHWQKSKTICCFGCTKNARIHPTIAGLFGCHKCDPDGLALAPEGEKFGARPAVVPKQKKPENKHSVTETEKGGNLVRETVRGVLEPDALAPQVATLKGSGDKAKLVFHRMPGPLVGKGLKERLAELRK